MRYSYTEKKRLRKYFGQRINIKNIPDLINTQISSFKKFIAKDGQNKSTIDEILSYFFPIKSKDNNVVLQCLGYHLTKPDRSIDKCKINKTTFDASLYIELELVVYENKDNVKKIKKIITEKVNLAEIPLMTSNGTFVINGTERVVVAQLHRSPGVFFYNEKNKINYFGKMLYRARIIPYRGAWLDFEFDAKNYLIAVIDKKKKIPVTILLHAFNYNNSQILNLFYKKIVYEICDNRTIKTKFVPKLLYGEILPCDIKFKDGTLIKKGNRVNAKNIKQFQNEGNSEITLPIEYFLGKVIAKNYNNGVKKNVITANTKITPQVIDVLIKSKNKYIEIIYTNDFNCGNYISETLRIDPTNSYTSALLEICYIMNPYEIPTYESAKNILKNLFFSKRYYDLSEVGRMKINSTIFKEYNSNGPRTLRKEDVIGVVKKLIKIKDGKGEIDDIDHLGNRRIKLVGELLEQCFHIGLEKITRLIKNQINVINLIDVTPQSLINSKTISSLIKGFFCTNPLSQFMDQTNSLAEITHKRRITALGHGGLVRERAGFEVRDVHSTHYGRICPIETPEGPNIGLINSLAIYAKVNEYGFLETPYRLVKNGIITKEIHYLSASKEQDYVIAQGNTKIDKKNRIVQELNMCRYKSDIILFEKNKIQYIDVSAQQIVSVGVSLIPFLEHNDANRSLMGANMQRQAVPIIMSEAPLVGTGTEKIIAMDSRTVILAKRGGVIQYVDGSNIFIEINKDEIKDDEVNIEQYQLIKYKRSNQSTCINQRPCVSVGDHVSKGDIIADGMSTDLGEIALGYNIRIAFMTWQGNNFEDAILISERLVKEDIFTSIHLEELTCTCKETKLGKEIITREIPYTDISEKDKLDKFGIVYIGAEIEENDIIVGKVSPIENVKISPEEKLLKTIFGEKITNTKDTSFRVPNGFSGTVIDVKILTKEDKKLDEQELEMDEIKKDKEKEKKIEEFNVFRKKICLDIEKILVNNGLEKKELNEMNYKILIKKKIRNINEQIKIHKLINLHDELVEDLEYELEKIENRVNKNNEFSNDVVKIVKIYVAKKRKIQSGDKMSGRHGNKGVVSRINLIEDMPYDKNGVPVDIILNPLGVPSRMNIGQVLETHLGMATHEIGIKISNMLEKNEKISKIRNFLQKIYNLGHHKDARSDISNLSDKEILRLANNLKKGIPIASPVFDGVLEEDIKKLFEIVGLCPTGQITLFDGKTGEKFERKVTVGYMYMLKLNHLVEDKMHTRSTGKYSLITQQPLGGKSQFGGQRLGEMEVWALEAYGAAYTLQEMLTIKSDDMTGRSKIYKNILNNKNILETTIPESFNVLIKEIQSLCIKIELKRDK